MATPANEARVAPHSIEAEKSVLGAMILEKEAIAKAVEILKEDAFYREAHRRIFRAIAKLYERDEVVDVVTLAEELKKQGSLEQVGGPAYLSSLLDTVATSASIEYHCRLVLEKATMRKLINAATQVVSDCFAGKDEVSSLIDKAEQMIFSVSGERLRRGFVPVREILKHSFETIQELYDRKLHVTGVPTGFTDLDTWTAGFQPSDLVVIAGRPSMGKTSFALNVAQNVAIQHKGAVAFFSLEMSKEQVVQRMLCAEARVDAHRLRTGHLRENEWPRLTTAAGLLTEAAVFVDDTPAIGVLEMRAKARRLMSEHDVKLVIVDYLQLVSGPARSESRQQEISQISRSLKALAKELNVPVLALSQLSRAVETRGGDRRPVLSDLRESGAIEQDADVVIFIYRPEVYKSTPENKGRAELIIGKQRNGPVGTVELAFVSQYARFENLTKVPEPQWTEGES